MSLPKVLSRVLHRRASWRHQHMKRRTCAASLALAALAAVLGLAVPVAAGEQVPFRGSLAGSFTQTPISFNPLILFTLATVTGNATHLGEFTLTIPHEVNPATMTATGSYHFTAANGDMLAANFSGQASLTPTPGVLSVVETATITGGTGRFAGASGAFTVERLVDRVALTTSGSFNGTISSPGR